MAGIALQDIRSYFGNISETPSKPPKGTEGKNLKSKKRNRRILDSDNDSSEDEKSVLALHKKRYRGGPKSGNYYIDIFYFFSPVVLTNGFKSSS